MRSLTLSDAPAQGMIDDLARTLGRAVLVEDRRQRVVLYTEHNEPADDMRRLSILRRQRPAEVVRWFRARGVYGARRPVRTPECPPLAMLPRLCVPIAYEGAPLGLMSFVDAGPGMTAEEIEVAVRLAADLGRELHHERSATEHASRRETEAVRELLLGPREGHASLAQALVEEGRIRSPEAVAALVVRPLTTGPYERERRTVTQALETTRRWFGPRECLRLMRYDHGVLVVSMRGDAARRTVDDCAARLRAHAGAPVIVGIGQVRQRLADARDSYEEALSASRVGAVLPGLGPVAHWSELGVYRVLSQLAGQDSAGVHPGLEEMFTDENKLALLETLEVFLDLAGNVHATAARLHLHRATLYYRLQRIAELAPANLKDGNERLCLHLALKVGRLTGRYRPSV